MLTASALACQTDERLVELFRAGHEAAFDALVRRHRGPLLSYCRRLLGDDRSEDVVQQAFVSAYGVMRDGTGDRELRVRPWLYRIAHNAAIDVLRRERADELPLGMDHAGVDRPDEALERRERLRETVSALQALPQRQRDAFVFQELEGCSHEEIACRMGVSEGSVRQLIHRARGSLRAAVAAVTPLSLLENLIRAPRAEAFAARVPDLIAGAAASGGLAKATVAMVAVTAAGGAGATTIVAFDASAPASADGRASVIAAPPATPAADRVDEDRTREPEPPASRRRLGERPKRRDPARRGRHRLRRCSPEPRQPRRRPSARSESPPSVRSRRCADAATPTPAADRRSRSASSSTTTRNPSSSMTRTTLGMSPRSRKHPSTTSPTSRARGGGRA